MKQFLIPLSGAIALSVTVVWAEPEDDDPGGVLNPDEMTWQSILDRAEEGETGMVLCSTGYMLTKSGDHATARALFENCANAGYTGAMTWMSQLDNNGLGGDYDPVLTLLENNDDVLQVEFTEFGLDKKRLRGIPVKKIKTVEKQNQTFCFE